MLRGVTRVWPGAEDKATWTEVASYTAGRKTRPQVQGFWNLKGVLRIRGGFSREVMLIWVLTDVRDLRWEVRGCHRKGEVCFSEKSKMLK